MQRIEYKKTISLAWGLLALLFLVAPVSANTSYVHLVRDELAFARENLRVSLATEEHVAATLKALKLSGRATPDVIADYERYLLRVAEMVVENRKLVDRLETLQATNIGVPGGPASETEGEPAPKSGAVISGKQGLDPVDPVDALDRQLDDSLAEFDALLLKELALIRTSSTERMRDLSQEAAAAARRLKEKGIDLTSGEGDEVPPDSEGRPGERGKSGKGRESGSENKTENDPEKAGESADSGEGDTEKAGKSANASDGETGKTGKSADSGDGEAGGERAERDRSGESMEGIPRGKQARYESGADDDIVARQLREAAEEETDPELKEKLWKEYEAYKHSQP